MPDLPCLSEGATSCAIASSPASHQPVITFRRCLFPSELHRQERLPPESAEEHPRKTRLPELLACGRQNRLEKSRKASGAYQQHFRTVKRRASNQDSDRDSHCSGIRSCCAHTERSESLNDPHCVSVDNSFKLRTSYVCDRHQEALNLVSKPV